MSLTPQDRLAAAVAALCGHAPLKDRLALAWSSHLESLDPLLLPEEVRSEFILLGALLHSVRALPGDTVVRASVRKLSPAEATQCADFVVRALACTVAQATRSALEAEAARADEGRDGESMRMPALRIAGGA